MDKHICKAQSIYDDSWVCGYYVKVPWAGNTAHLIIEPTAEYKGAGEFDWRHIYRVDPDTVCICDNT